ncbi:dihydroorotate dehydrogenase (quinone) [Campylobacter sp. MIT 12-5580]|uniref:quinone-dependent dihydroorotate dehydrogenase n=1 Tax=Campylobacter sp. MIT 12-5580 TaxID=2040651 RepID=UPI0010F9B48E|nr:quinone-dependent dihydroorotate dehydrogenase [Campylobacter sp. MIT 12-5580]TKX28803.1 dihydroorotate dehydrogenase (quinone) [Campylobacter sp. MIT 12-5580]
MSYEFFKPLLFKLDPENAHHLAEWALRSLNFVCPGALSFLAKNYIVDDDSLKQELCGLYFNNPVGLAGGFDKNATMIRPLSALGFGFLEFGTFTPKAQKGNDKPRLFRLIEQESLQNAMGFNNEGKDKIASRLANLYPFILPLGANIGKNKTTSNEEALSDYLILLKSFENLCDYFIINISSPNTQNLRDLQSENFIKELFKEAKAITSKPIFLKIAPDMSIDKALKLCECAIKEGVSGLIIANTSTDYSLLDNNRTFGGISGKLIQEKSGIFFKELAKTLFGKTLLIASGGIDSAEVAYERIKNGANLVQVYTAFIYKGPSIAAQINQGLVELLRKDQFVHISQAVGANLK